MLVKSMALRAHSKDRKKLACYDGNHLFRRTFCNLVRCDRFEVWSSTTIGARKLWLWRNLTKRLSIRQLLLWYLGSRCSMVLLWNL